MLSGRGAHRIKDWRPGGPKEVSRGCREARPKSPVRMKMKQRPGRDARIRTLRHFCPAPVSEQESPIPLTTTPIYS